MKLNQMMTVVKKSASRIALKAQKHSPEILITVGVVSIIGGTVMACKATLKAEEILDDYAENMNFVNDAHTKAEECGTIDYTEQDVAKDKTIILVQTGWKFVKLYAPSATFVLGGIGCVLSAYGIMRKRNVALMAAYKAIETSFNDYRSRVIKELGENEDKHFLYGTPRLENGTVPEMKPAESDVDTDKVIDIYGIQPSVYAKYFNETSHYWVKNAEYNLIFLHQMQDHANDVLRAQGHLFLNEVYSMLGLPHTQAGAVVGWVLDDKHDGYVDFGIYRVKDPNSAEFVNGFEQSILLDFNVDGVIYDLI